MKRILLLCMGFLFGTTLLQADIVKPPPPPVWSAEKISFSVPDSFEAGKPTTVTFTMRNNGNQAWVPGTVLLKITLTNNVATSDITLNNSVNPGQQCVFTTALTLDYDESQFESMQWQMYHVTNHWFGQIGSSDYAICQNEMISNLAHFNLTFGPEFPGAQGHLSYEYSNNMPYPANPAVMGYKLGIYYDLSDPRSHYVSAEYSHDLPFLTRAVVFNVKSNPGINIVLRVRDESGQVLQYSARRPYKITDPNGWYLLSFDLQAPPDCFWGGANDGTLHGEITWLAILPCNPVDRTPANAIGCVYVTNVRLMRDLPVANVPLPMIDEWAFSNGPEFPGATESHSYNQGQTQQRKILLSYDLRTGGHYVAATYNIPTLLSAKAISFLVKPKPGIQVFLRVQDSTGQTLQYRTILPLMVDASGWYRQVVDLATPPEGHWGGSNNGVFSGKVNSISIIAGDPLHWDRTDAFGTLEIEDVEVLDNLSPVDVNLLLSNSSLWAPIYDADVLSRLGVTMWPDYQALDSAKAAGFSWIRTDLTWTRVEPEPGVWDFSYYDALLDSLDVPERNMKALLILDYGHPCYTGDTSRMTPPTISNGALDDFGRFADSCASHFKNGGHNNIAYEIWNEQNDPTFFWRPDANPVDYWNMTQTVIPLLRAVDPNVKITTGGLALVDFSYLRRYLSNFHDNPQYPNAIGVHPYRPDGPESAAADIAYWRAIIKDSLPTINPPTWNTEWGYSSNWYGNGQSLESRERQGIMAARELLTCTALNFPLMIYFDIKDGSDPSVWDQNCGLLDQNYNDKPAMKVVRTFTNAMRGCDNVAVLPVEQANVYGMYCHKSNGLGSTAIIWYRGPGQATVKLPNVGTYQITNVFGTQMQIPSSGQLTLTDSIGPIYLNFGNNTNSQSKQIVNEKQKRNICENCYENRLYGAAPNPSKGLTMIRYSIKQAAPVKISVYNVMGQLVSTLVHEVKPAGMYSVQWNGRNETGQTVSNGMYLYRIQAGEFRDTKKMMVVR